MTGFLCRVVGWLFGAERLPVVLCWEFVCCECEKVIECFESLGLWVHVGEVCECWLMSL